MHVVLYLVHQRPDEKHAQSADARLLGIIWRDGYGLPAEPSVANANPQFRRIGFAMDIDLFGAGGMLDDVRTCLGHRELYVFDLFDREVHPAGDGGNR
jgi:hypothetical protein